MNKSQVFPTSSRIHFTSSVPRYQHPSSCFCYVQLPARAEAIRHLSERLQGYVRLPYNWNGYQAREIPQAVISNTISALDEIGQIGGADVLPEISPQPLGVIALKWKTDSGEAYIEIGETRFSGYIELAGGKTYYLQGDARQSKLNALLIVYERLFSPGQASSLHTFEVGTSAYPALVSSVSLSGGYSGSGSYCAGGVLSVHDQQEQQGQIGYLRSDTWD